MVMAAIHLSVPFNSHHCHCRHCAQCIVACIAHCTHCMTLCTKDIAANRAVAFQNYRWTFDSALLTVWALCTQQVCTKRCAVLSIKSSPPHLDIGKGGGGRIDEKIQRNIFPQHWNSHFFLSISSHANLLKAGVSFCRSGSYHSTDQPSVNPSLARCLLWLLIMWHLNVKL